VSAKLTDDGSIDIEAAISRKASRGFCTVQSLTAVRNREWRRTDLDDIGFPAVVTLKSDDLLYGLTIF
jgi:hypothetical protein